MAVGGGGEGGGQGEEQDQRRREEGRKWEDEERKNEQRFIKELSICFLVTDTFDTWISTAGYRVKRWSFSI